MRNTVPARAQQSANAVTAQLATELIEARKNVAYWRRQQLLRFDHTAKVQAGALAQLWESTLATREARFNAAVTAIAS